VRGGEEPEPFARRLARPRVQAWMPGSRPGMTKPRGLRPGVTKATERGKRQFADAAGYGTEAAFNRAFSRRFGSPPAEWRRTRTG
jgi:hypothetical protein